jgi:pantoate--beta-alanine ligase
VTVCSIFVNPKQFNDPRDYEAYSVNLERDAALLAGEGVDFLFAPSVSEVYPPDFQTKVSVGQLGDLLEGASRPGHFPGVATVVSILFNAVAPRLAIFGEKDFQQLRVIEQMVEDLKFDIEVIRGELVRDTDGLALSSRNVRLSPEGRRNALAIHRGLVSAQAMSQQGERSAERLEGVVRRSLNEIAVAEIDYVVAVHEDTLHRSEVISPLSRMLVAVTIEGVRLLDNIPLR